MRHDVSDVHPREKILRACIIGCGSCVVPATGASLAPSWLLPAFVATIFIVLGSIAGGLALAFYAVWTIGWLTEMNGASPNILIGDSSLDVPQPYWPWSRRIKRLRYLRRIDALEREVGLLSDGTFRA